MKPVGELWGNTLDGRKCFAATANMLFWIDMETMTVKWEMVIRNIESHS